MVVFPQEVLNQVQHDKGFGFCWHIIVGLLLAITSPLYSQPYFPELGTEAVHQRSLDLNGNLNVLSIALQPGFEDMGALAYFRMGRGAKIMSVYATNGEAGESDLRSEYPHQLAAIRREEADSALRFLNGTAYFLNLPDLPAASDTTQVRELWNPDSVQYRLMSVISQFRPDLILVSRDMESTGPSLRWRILLADILRAVERLRILDSKTPPKELLPFALWDVGRVVADDGLGKGLLFPLSRQHPLWKKTYEMIGVEAAGSYASLHIQRAAWLRGKRQSYKTEFPKSSRKLRTPDEGLPEALPSELRSVAKLIETVTRAAQQTSSARASSRPTKVLTQLADAINEVDVRLARSITRPSRERKLLLAWKEGLESLRLQLLGVTVRYQMTETTLTDLQLTYLTIDTVTGVSPGGTTEIYFPSVGRGWALNEALENRLPLQLGQGYRLLLQNAKPFNTPHWLYGLEDHTLNRPFYFFIMHKSAKREENFVHRTVVPLKYAPRFATEILTPIVRAIPGERLAFRVTNHSRDGVRDEIHANDSAVASTRSAFRLNQKGAAHQDTLTLQWSTKLPEGVHLFPVKVGQDEIASYLVRSFPVSVDSSKRTGIVRGVPASAAIQALERLGLTATVLQSDRDLSQALSQLDVVIIDRRALTLNQALGGQREQLSQFVQRGGHLVILAQDAELWNAAPMIPGLRLQRSLSYTAQSAFVLDSTQVMVLTPNNLRIEDWSEWLFRQAYNTVSLEAGSPFEVVCKDKKSGNPLVVSLRSGSGWYTYIDLDLEHQWLNLHAGALRMLANVIAR